MDLVAAIIEHLRDLNIKKRWVITNGYWALREEESKRILSKLKESGLRGITFSVDAFHQEYIPFNCVRRGIGSAVAVGFDTIAVDSYFLSKRRDNKYDKITMHYQEELKALELKMARTKYEEKLLIEDIGKQQAEFQKLFDSAQLLEKENNALQRKRELLDAIRRRLDQKNMERNVPGPIEVLKQASVSSEPYKDRRVLYTAVVLILDGLGITLSGCLLHRHGFL